MKKSGYIILLLIIFISTSLKAQIPFDLRTGDILFQVNGSSSYTDAIRDVTSGIKGLEFTHVGVAYIENDSVFVLEAIPYGVMKTPVAKFFKQSKKYNDNPMVVVGRLKHRYQKAIPEAIATIKTLLGKRYDFVFTPDDDKYYCSEIIYISYLRPNGKPIFKANPMTFKDKTTGEMSSLWIKHFKIHKQEIPEGVLGTNPGDMSRSKQIKIVHRYF